MGARGAKLADEFEQVVQELAGFVEQCPDDRWMAVCGPEGWTVAQTAQHVSGQFSLEMEYITAAADGKPLPRYSWDDINNKNDNRAAKNAAVSKASVIEELQRGASSTVAYLRGLSDDQLDRTGELALADGASVSTQQLIEGGVLIDHVRGHLQSMRAAQ